MSDKIAKRIITYNQELTLRKLKNALGLSTIYGLLDVLQPYCRSHESINDVCDAVADLLKECEATEGS